MELISYPPSGHLCKNTEEHDTHPSCCGLSTRTVFPLDSFLGTELVFAQCQLVAKARISTHTVSTHSRVYSMAPKQEKKQKQINSSITKVPLQTNLTYSLNTDCKIPVLHDKTWIKKLLFRRKYGDVFPQDSLLCYDSPL